MILYPTPISWTNMKIRLIRLTKAESQNWSEGKAQKRLCIISDSKGKRINGGFGRSVSDVCLVNLVYRRRGRSGIGIHTKSTLSLSFLSHPLSPLLSHPLFLSHTHSLSLSSYANRVSGVQAGTCRKKGRWWWREEKRRGGGSPGYPQPLLPYTHYPSESHPLPLTLSLSLFPLSLSLAINEWGWMGKEPLPTKDTMRHGHQYQ